MSSPSSSGYRPRRPTTSCSPAPLYAPLWQTLQRKAALAARTCCCWPRTRACYKTLLQQTIRCNKLPNAIQFQQDELHTYATFLADQIANVEGLEECALVGMREAIGRMQRTRRRRRDLDGSPDGGKRARKAPRSRGDAVPLAAFQEPGRRRGRGGGKAGQGWRRQGGGGATGAKAGADGLHVLFEGGAPPRPLGDFVGAEPPPSFTEIGRIVGERWKACEAVQRARYEAIAEATASASSSRAGRTRRSSMPSRPPRKRASEDPRRLLRRRRPPLRCRCCCGRGRRRRRWRAAGGALWLPMEARVVQVASAARTARRRRRAQLA